MYAGSAAEGGRIDTVFFTSSEELTEDSNTGSEDQGNDLYAYNLGTGKLTDITPDGNPDDVNGASVESFIGSSTSGSLVYFKAAGVLTKVPNGLGESAQLGASNIYVYDTVSGKTTFIAPGPEVGGPGFRGRGNSNTGYVNSEVTPDGQHFVFVSSESLTSYKQDGNRDVYLYDEATDRLTCVSCDPSGAPPAGGAFLAQESPEGYSDGIEGPGTLQRPLVVSDDGSRVFFSSPDQLTAEAPLPAPKHTTSVEVLTRESLEPNVYEWENGHIYLIAAESAALTTTPSGNDVLFDTAAQLVPQDRDGSPDVYDARVGGGFPQLAAPACSGTACQGVPAAPPIFATPPSVTFNGVGNFPPPPSSTSTVRIKPKPAKCKKNFVKEKNKCVKKAKVKKSAHRRGK